MPSINEVATNRQQKISKSNLDFPSLNKRVEAQNPGFNAGLRALSAACGQLNDNKIRIFTQTLTWANVRIFVFLYN